jgi:integrase
MTDDKAKKKPERRAFGQRETIIAGKKYRIRVFLGKDTVTGKRHYHNETFHGTAGQTDERIREIKRRHLAGEPVRANADTFGSFLDEWLAAQKLSVAESSLEHYRIVVEKHLRPAFGNKLLVTLTADDIQRLYLKLHNDGLGRVTIGNVHTLLGMVLKFAVLRKKLIGSPMAGVRIPKGWGGGEERPSMSAEQVGKFLEAAKGNRFENLFNLAFHVGFRPGELLALQWADFDQDARTLRVSHNLVWRKPTQLKANPKLSRWYLGPPKTKSSRRTLPLTVTVLDVLKRQRSRQLEMRLKAGKLWTDHGFIFTDEAGEPFTHWALHNDFEKAMKAAGIVGRFSPKSARHTMASLLAAAKHSPRVVQERMGHQRIATTLDYYVHTLSGAQVEVSEDMEQILKGKK